MTLVAIKPPEYDVDLQLAYGTPDNITGKPIYKNPTCWLHPDAAAILSRTIELANDINLRLRIFDGYRPTEAQWVLWRHNPNPTFVTNPERGSPHSRGIAIDLTLIDRKNNKALEMGTDFDDFSDKAFHNCKYLDAEYRENRFLLLGLMASAGWDYYLNEWWHYQLFESRKFPLISNSELPKSMMDKT